MNWEETIKFIRTKPDYKYLVEKAYFEEDLPLNVERFRNSEEFIETLSFIKKYSPNAKTLLDIGSGNGISAISFALSGFKVKCIEPDPSETVGAGAIRKLIENYNLDNIEVFESFAENINFPDNCFDIVYARQCMHHAFDLNKFVFESTRVLNRGGMFFTVRDHVIYNEKDKDWFLISHPLQKYYGGENAYTSFEYLSAFEKAGLKIKQVLDYYDSVINYFPLDSNHVRKLNTKILINDKKIIVIVLRKIKYIPYVKYFVSKLLEKFCPNYLDERLVPGRMYSYISIKE